VSGSAIRIAGVVFHDLLLCLVYRRSLDEISSSSSSSSSPSSSPSPSLLHEEGVTCDDALEKVGSCLLWCCYGTIRHF
jgi:cellulase/cellobiase CelA1